MLMKTFLSFMAFVLCSFPVLAQAPFNPQTTGEHLERLWWDLQKNQDIAGLSKIMSPAFQSINSKGAQDLAANLAIIKAEKLGDYRLANIKVTQSHDNLIITYEIAASENYLGKSMSKKPHYRMDVWKKSATGWQIIAHANLNPI